MFGKTVATLAVILTASAACAAQSPAMRADTQAVRGACAPDAQATGCAGVGRGQLRCMRDFKKAHPGIRFSPPCRAAIKQRRADKRAGM